MIANSINFDHYRKAFTYMVEFPAATPEAAARHFRMQPSELKDAIHAFFGSDGVTEEGVKDYDDLYHGSRTSKPAAAPAPQDADPADRDPEPLSTAYTLDPRYQADLARWEAHGHQTADTWRRYRPLMLAIAFDGESKVVADLMRETVYEVTPSAYKVFKSERFGAGPVHPNRAAAFIWWADSNPLAPRPAPKTPETITPPAPTERTMNLVEIKPPTDGRARMAFDVRFTTNKTRPGFCWSSQASRRVPIEDKQALPARVYFDTSEKVVLIVAGPSVVAPGQDAFLLRKYKDRVMLGSIAFLEPMKAMPQTFSMKVEEPEGSLRILLSPA